MTSAQASSLRFTRIFKALKVVIVVSVVLGFLSIFAMDLWFGTQAGHSPIRRTKVAMATIRNAINSYHTETSSYPATLQALVPSYLAPDNPLKDGWRHDFYYEAAAMGNNSDQPYVLRSMGSDGIFNTPDDLDVWTLDGPMTKIKK